MTIVTVSNDDYEEEENRLEPEEEKRQASSHLLGQNKQTTDWTVIMTRSGAWVCVFGGGEARSVCSYATLRQQKPPTSLQVSPAPLHQPLSRSPPPLPLQDVGTVAC